jgi:hypothetical protein
LPISRNQPCRGHGYEAAKDFDPSVAGTHHAISNSGGVQQDVFVTFLGQSAMFSSFSAVQPSFAGETYDYFYGVGLAQ